MRMLILPLCLAAGALCGHPDIGPPSGLPHASSAQPDEQQKEQLRHYFDLFTFLINGTITPLQQDMIDQANALYLGLVPWADGGDPEHLIADAAELAGRLKTTLAGYAVDWGTDSATVAAPAPLALTQGLPSHIWLEVGNSTAASVSLRGYATGTAPGRIATTIRPGDRRVLLVPVPARPPGSSGPLLLSLTDSATGETTRGLSLPVTLAEAAVIRGTILERAGGQPFPGRVQVTGSDGIGRVGEAFKHNPTLSEKQIFEISSENRFGTYRLPFFYSDGSFEVIVPAGETRITLERGYEHEIVATTVTAVAGETAGVTLTSGRFLDMKELGWISGDTHIHWVKNWWSENEDIGLLAMVQRAEDLRVANNLTLFQYRPEHLGGNFTTPSQFPMGPVESLSDGEYHIQMGEEYRNDHFYGHLCFLNINSLIQPISTGEGSGGPPGALDWPLNKTAIEACHAQGGISTEAHNLGPNHRSDVPVNAVMGLSDAFDQMDPEHYYRFLDCGLQVPLGNGSDHPARTIGSARMYVKVDGPFTYGGWIDGIRKGRTFTTSGPLVFLTVNGRDIGDTLEVGSGDTLRVRASVRSRHPVGRFQVVSNGEVLAQTETSGTTAVLEFEMPADTGRWFVARCSQNGNYSALSRPAIAHTSGIYVKVDGRGPFKPDAARHWVTLLRAHHDNVRQNANYAHDWQRQAQLDYIGEGIARYEALIATAVAAPRYYVSSSSGSDANSGLEPGQAWASFGNLAGRTLQPGSAVYLKRGDTWTAARLELAGKGTADAPITLSAYGEGPLPVITGIDRQTAACVVWNNPSHVRIDSLHCRDAKIGIYLRFTGGNIDGTGEMFNNRDVHISNCHFENMDEKWSDENGAISVVPPYELSWGAGIWLGGTIPAPPGGPWPSEMTRILDDFSVTHCGFRNVNTGLGNGFYHPHVYRSRFTNVRFEDSWVTGCENGAFALFFVDGGHARRIDTWLGGEDFYATGTTAGFIQSSRNFLIEDCQFAGNLRPATSNDGVGFDIEGDCEAITVRNCVLHDNDGGGFLVLNSGGYNNALVLEDLTIWNNCRNPRQGSRRQNAEMRYAGSPAPPNPAAYGLLSNSGIYLGTDAGVGDAAGYLSAFDRPADWLRDFSPVNIRTGTAWQSVAARPLAWDFAASTGGWGNTHDWDGFAASGGALVGVSTGNDAFVESPDTWVNTRERRWIRVSMSSTAGDVAMIFFQTETEPFFTGPRAVAFPVIADGRMREYRVDMGANPLYRGVVTRWRLDPTTESGSHLAVAAFAAEQAPRLVSVNPVAPNVLDLRFSQAMLVDGGVFDPGTYTLAGLGRGSAASRPDSVTLVPTPSGPVYRLVWNSGSMNGLEAELRAAGATDPRGHALWSGSRIAFVTTPLPAPDRDLDGMPDAWEDANGLDADDPSDAGRDDDQDGYPNLAEYLANTDPRDSASALAISDIRIPASGEFLFTWASAHGMAYHIDTSPDLVNWTRLEGEPVPSAGAATSVLIESDYDRLFLRVLPVRPNPLLGSP